MVSVEADLTHDLTPGVEIVEFDGEALAVKRGAESVFSIKLNEVDRAYVEEGIGMGKLILILKDGRSVEAAYFTKRKIAAFRSLARAVNLRRPEAAERELASALGRANTRASSTLFWLFSQMAPYKYRLAAGLALSLIITALNLVPPYLLKILIDGVLLSQTHDRRLFVELTAALAASYAAVSALSMAQNYVLNTLGQRVVNDLRGKLYAKILRLSPSAIDRITTGRILSRLTTDAGNAQWLMVWGLPTLLVNSLTLAGIGVILFSMNPSLAVYVLLPTPIIIYILVHYRRVSRLLPLLGVRLDHEIVRHN
ncbi:MAG: DUF1854 domain-containing protein, partial [Thermoproteus sp.]|nr:DUF1854 domain-containing protein [Thermoproteus sp.]